MTGKGITKSPPKGVLRWLLRAPLILHRVGLSWMLGKRFMVLEHTGRKTGKLRETVVEVVLHDLEDDTYYIASGWGYRAQWYLNIIVQPDLTIHVGRRKLQVHAEILAPEAGAAVLETYREQYPMAARELSRVMGIPMDEAPPDELMSIVQDSLPMIALKPR